MILADKKAPAILLVDDEPTFLFTYKAILECGGYTVETAMSFSEGTQLLQRGSYDAVIVDLNLEKEILGLELLRHVRALANPPITVVYTRFPSIERLYPAL